MTSDIERGGAAAGGKGRGATGYNGAVNGAAGPSPFYYDAGSSAEREWTSWMVPMIVVANVAMFVVIMYVNNCPAHANPCVARFLHRNLTEGRSLLHQVHPRIPRTFPLKDRIFRMAAPSPPPSPSSWAAHSRGPQGAAGTAASAVKNTFIDLMRRSHRFSRVAAARRRLPSFLPIAEAESST